MIKPLTSLRFFFALFVFLSHISFVKTENVLYNWLQRNIFFEGYLGVSFFFILSGFVLSYSYKKKILENNISKTNFFIARLARIYPLHFMTLLLSIPILYPKETIDIGNLIVNILLLQSFSFSDYQFYSLNPPSWSISDEMFFYLLFPFIILAFDKIKFLKHFFYAVIPIILIISILTIPAENHKTFFYINPFIRYFDFILGILLFDLYKSGILSRFFTNFKRATFVEILTILIFFVFFIFHNYFSRCKFQ